MASFYGCVPTPLLLALNPWREILTSGARAEIPERIAPESLQKIFTKFYEVAGHVWVDLNWKSRTCYVKCFEVVYTRQQNARQHKFVEINWRQFLLLSQIFCYWDKQQSADSNTIQLHLTLKCTKGQSSHFCDCFLVSNWIFHQYDRSLTKFHAGSKQPLVCVVINNSHYRAVKNNNTAYRAFWKYWMQARGLLKIDKNTAEWKLSAVHVNQTNLNVKLST